MTVSFFARIIYLTFITVLVLLLIPTLLVFFGLLITGLFCFIVFNLLLQIFTGSKK